MLAVVCLSGWDGWVWGGVKLETRVCVWVWGGVLWVLGVSWEWWGGVVCCECGCVEGGENGCGCGRGRGCGRTRLLGVIWQTQNDEQN